MTRMSPKMVYPRALDYTRSLLFVYIESYSDRDNKSNDFLSIVRNNTNNSQEAKIMVDFSYIQVNRP